LDDPDQICVCGHLKSSHIFGLPEHWKEVNKCEGAGYHERIEPFPTGLPDDFPKAIETNCLCKGFKPK